MQLAGWIGTTEIHWLQIPGWMGTWFSLFNNWETFIGQFIALSIVLGSYLAAQYLRVWRPRRRGEQAARLADAAPERPSDLAGCGRQDRGTGTGTGLVSRDRPVVPQERWLGAPQPGSGPICSMNAASAATCCGCSGRFKCLVAASIDAASYPLI